MATFGNEVFRFAPMGAHVATSGSGLGALTPPAGATKLMIQCSTQAIRYTLDGSTPSATQGFYLTANAAPVTIPISSGTIVQIAVVASGAWVNYQWGN
jgi:hypothetical protein